METTKTAREGLDAIPVDSFVRVSDLPGSPDAARATASRAAKRGDLVQIRRGLYFKGTKTRYGMTRPSEEEIALEVLGTRGVGPTGFSAARALGVTTQIPSRIDWVITGPKPLNVPGVRVFSRNNRARLELAFAEIALLEVLRTPATLVEGGWGELVEAVRGLVKAGKIRFAAVESAVTTEHNPAVRDNFRRLVADLKPL